MKKKLLVFLLIGVLVFSIVGCGNNAEKPKSDIKVAMVTDEGGVHDQSFNQSAWEGLQKAAEDFGIKVSYV